jgi:hypothetical protein
MADVINLDQRYREEARWRILRVVDAGRPIAVSEHVVWRVLNDLKIPFSLMQLRRELDYLSDLGLLAVEGQESENWFARLTAAGVDVVEYNAKAPSGIARPRN